MVHQYKLGGYDIVLDVCSGSIHGVDDIAYDIISEFEIKDKNEIIKQLLEKYKDDKEVTEKSLRNVTGR